MLVRLDERHGRDDISRAKQTAHKNDLKCGEIKRSHFARLAIRLCQWATSEVSVEDCHSAETHKRDDCADKSEEDNVFDVCEELLPLHVEATCEHNGRQAKVEEEVVAELHQLVEILLRR